MSKAVFLSAGVPREKEYALSVEPLLVREAVIALTRVALPEIPIVFGGQPAISPMIESAATALRARNRIFIFQSRFFEDCLPEEAKRFENIIWTENKQERDASLREMRKRMIELQGDKIRQAGITGFIGGVFVGGKEGVIAEHRCFAKIHPTLPRIALASVGGASRQLAAESKYADMNARVSLWDQEANYEALFRWLVRK